MFVLVLFTDEVYLICTPKDISSFKTRCPPVKYTDGRKYTARIIAVHEDRQLLEDIQRSLNSAVYCIKLPNLKYTGECLTYRKVVDHLKGSQDVNKLYLDPSVVLSPGKTEENYVLSLKGKKITKAYFDKQPNLVEMEIKTADVNESSDKPIFESNSVDEKRATDLIADEPARVTNGAEKPIFADTVSSTITDEIVIVKNADDTQVIKNGSDKTVDDNCYNDAVLLENDADNPTVDDAITNENGYEKSASSNLPPRDHEPATFNGALTSILHKKNYETDENYNIPQNPGQACSFYNAKEVIRVSPITVQAKSADV